MKNALRGSNATGSQRTLVSTKHWLSFSRMRMVIVNIFGIIQDVKNTKYNNYDTTN